MDALAAATETASAVGGVAGRYMLDGETYKKGAGLGFQGIDFYAGGRGGVLGEVDADVVAAAFTFFEPGYVRSQWELAGKVMSRAEAADAWAAACGDWARAHVPDDFDLLTLGGLLDTVVATARPAGAVVFSGWRALPVPEEPKAHVVHQMNSLRELRHGLHSAAVLAAGLSPHQALSYRTPGMVPIFGWPEPAEVADVGPRWAAAETATNVAIAHAYAGLDDDQRDQLVELVQALDAATAG